MAEAFRTIAREHAPELQRQAKAAVAAQVVDPELRANLEKRFGPEKVARFLQQQEDENFGDLLRLKVRAELPGRFPALATLEKAVEAHRDNKPDDFNAAVAEYHSQHTSMVSSSDLTKVRLEALMNHFDPFLQCAVLYIGVMLLAAASWLVWRARLRRAAFAIAVVALAVHTLALFARMYIGNRPPVTNLYSSAVFIGWGGLVLCLIMERWNKLGVGTFVGGALGFSTLYIA